MRKQIFRTILIGIIVCAGLNLNAQSGGKTKIMGIITDASTGDPLIGAAVAIEGTSFGASTNLAGEYVCHNLPAGTYTLLFRYLGYKDIDIANVVVVEGEPLELNMKMQVESILGEEVIISIQARGQMAAINQQRSSNAIVNIVASDRIREVPDATAAESIGRLPGVSLQRSAGEGNKVVIRGLSPKYSVIEMDGVRMEGTGGDRSVSLSSVSSETLGGIELTKSLTADKDADAIGGVVNMRTRTAEAGLHVNANATGGYNNFSNSYNNSFNGSVGNRFFDNKFGVLLSGGTERVNRNSDDFSASYGREITTEGNWLYTREGKITQNLRDRQRTNAGLVLDYKNDFLKIKFNNIYNLKHDNNESREAKYVFLNNRFDFNNSRSESDDAFQLHAISTEWKFWNTNLEADYAFSRAKFENENDLYLFEDKDSYSGSDKYDQNMLRERHPGELIMEGNELIKIENSAVRWNHRDDYLREDVSQTINLNWTIPYRIGDVAGNIKTGYRYKKKERTSDRLSKELYFHGGIGSGRREIVESQIYPDFDKLLDAGILATGLAGSNFADADYNYGEFLDGRYEFPYAVDLDLLTEVFDSIYNYIDHQPDIKLETWLQERGIESNEEDYKTTEKLNAGYIMAEINLGERVMILPGVRYENIQTEYTSRIIMTDPFNPIGINTPDYPDTVTSYRENGHWFPSVNMKVDITKWMDVRAAYYKSASRPDFSRLSPYMITDDGLAELRVKNPYLKPALAHNVDLGISFFTGRLGLFTINGFYKKINGLTTNLPEYQIKNIAELENNGGCPASVIESLSAPISLYDSTLIDPNKSKVSGMPINNPNPAEYAGFELSWQTNLWYLPGIWSGLVLDLNYTMLWSQTKLPYFDWVEVVDSSFFFPITKEEAKYAITDNTRMVDQPNILFNAKVGWDYKGFSSRVSFRYQASTITGQDARYHLTDSYNKNMFRIDLNIKQQITPKLSLSLDGTNLTNYIDDRVINNYVGDRDFAQQEQMYGMGIRLGIRYEF